MADEDKKGKTVPADPSEKSDSVKKTAVKKKTVAKKKVAKKKISKKKASAKKKSAATTAPVSANKSIESAQETKVTEKKPLETRPAINTTSAAANPSRKFEFIFVVLLAMFLAASIAILSDKRLEQKVLSHVHATMKFLGISEFAIRQQPDATSQRHEIKASAPPVTTPWFSRQIFAPVAKGKDAQEQAAVEAAPTVKTAPPATTPWLSREIFAPAAKGKGAQEQAAVEAAPAVVPQPPAMSAPPPQPVSPDTIVAKPVMAPVGKPAADVLPAPEAAATQPALAAPPPATSPAVVVPPVQPPESTPEVAPAAQTVVTEPARPTPSATDVQPVAPEGVTRQPVDRPSPRQPGYNPYSRYPYGYRGGYNRDYYDQEQGYPRRPQPRWPNY